MNVPLFTGEFRKKPVQSLRGASKLDTTDDLLEKSRKQRLLRQHRRQEEEAATRIQAFYRGSHSRRVTQTLTRQRFDELAAAAASVGAAREDFLLLVKCLNNFYLPHLDGDRLVQLCSLFLKHHSDLAPCRHPALSSRSASITVATTSTAEAATASDLDAFAVGKFLANTLAHLARLDQHSGSDRYAAPLRALELALAPSGPADSPSLRLYLASKGYFRHLAGFVTTKCGLANRTDLSDALAQPMVRAVCSLMLLPLVSPHNGGGNDHRDVNDEDGQVQLLVVEHLLRQTLCCPKACAAGGHGKRKQQPQPRWCLPGAVNIALATAEPLPPRVACHLIGPLLAEAASGSRTVGRMLLTAAVDVAEARQQPGPGLLHLLACRARQLVGAEGRQQQQLDVEACRLALRGLHGCRPCLRELPDDLAGEVVDCLADEWFVGELLRRGVLAAASYESGEESPLQLPPGECFVHLSSVCVMCPSLSLYSLTPSGPSRAAFLDAFWRSVSQFRYQPQPQLQHQQQQQQQQPVMQQIARAAQPPEPQALAALAPPLAAFARIFSPEALPRSRLLAISAELRDALLGLLLLSHPDARPDLLNADYVRALKSLDAAAAAAAASGSSAAAATSSLVASSSASSTSRELLALYSELFASLKLLVSRLYQLDQLCGFTGDASTDHWSVQGRVPAIKALQPAYWLERDPSVAASGGIEFGYYSVLNDAVSIPYLSSAERLQLAILTEAPYLIGFWDRVRLLYSLLHAYKAAIEYDRHEFGSSGLRVTARRDRVYEDAFSQLYGEENLYPRLKVVFRNELGLEEAGIDGGGLMREFLALVLSAAFDPERGFYSQTSSGALYPNPLSAAINPEHSAHYFFHGKLLGKLLFERLLIDLPLAPFFLRRVILYAGGARDAHQRSVATLHELAELDAELYKNVSGLSALSPAELEAMELDFSVVEDRLGRSETVELKPHGSASRVTPDSVSEYQQLLADYRLRRQIASQTRAFASGLASVIPCPDWLAFFSHKELQLLISGSDSPIDVADLRRHAAYQGCTPDSDTVAAFWRLMLDDLTEAQRRAVLRFVTSLTRAPLYGWRELQPPFTLALVPETDRLPSASTCINLLKLPDYKSQDVLKAKLLMAVESNSGFELS